MRIVASAPGRAGLLGNPSDGYGGCVISCTIPERATVCLQEADRLEAEVEGRSHGFTDAGDFRLRGDRFDVVRATVQFLKLFDLKLKLSITTDIPVQAGLAGSTAILTSLVAAVSAYLGQPHSRHYLAEMVRTIELNYLEVQCGYQDQYMTVFGGIQFMDFRGKENYRRLGDELYATVESLEAYTSELPFVLVQTGVRRVSTSVLKPIRERWLEGDTEVIRSYQRIARLCQRGKRAFIDNHWKLFAQLMNENHRLQRALGGSGEADDHIIRLCLDSGAWGAKLAGAGGGGTIIALNPDPEPMVAALNQAGVSCFLKLEPSPGVTVEKSQGLTM